MTTFKYNTANGVEETTEAFGSVWRAAREWATINHTIIERVRIKDGKETVEFCTLGGVFLPWEGTTATAKVW